MVHGDTATDFNQTTRRLLEPSPGLARYILAEREEYEKPRLISITINHDDDAAVGPCVSQCLLSCNVTRD